MDGVFRVTRVRGDCGEVLTYVTIAAYRTLLDEVLYAGTSLDPKEWAVLRSAFTAMFRLLSGEGPPTTGPVPYAPTCRSASRNRLDSVRRWFRGHHIFSSSCRELPSQFNSP